ncbi:hypothetical protein SLEP1_g48512 [Rubroshorea leprosula]|uniref:Uncharacterized protein n=1 Tax=Rubroshorea leprosula TaxID=152421 RepID=A0AAV5LUP9_9ROSI|nr:hypothetical protein SLEP1_g48512 [Rubroshorea leprosula]
METANFLSCGASSLQTISVPKYVFLMLISSESTSVVLQKSLRAPRNLEHGILLRGLYDLELLKISSTCGL